jgi:transposase-like protein
LSRESDPASDASAGILFVLDGGKALRRAVKDLFGDKALRQRLRLHKERNVADHLPETERLWCCARCARRWKNPDAAEAKRDLGDLAAAWSGSTPTPRRACARPWPRCSP